MLNPAPQYISLTQAAIAAKLSRQRLSVLCNTNRIEGAFKIGQSWAIPNPFGISPDPRKGRARLNDKVPKRDETTCSQKK